MGGGHARLTTRDLPYVTCTGPPLSDTILYTNTVCTYIDPSFIQLQFTCLLPQKPAFPVVEVPPMATQCDSRKDRDADRPVVHLRHVVHYCSRSRLPFCVISSSLYSYHPSIAYQSLFPVIPLPYVPLSLEHPYIPYILHQWSLENSVGHLQQDVAPGCWKHRNTVSWYPWLSWYMTHRVAIVLIIENTTLHGAVTITISNTHQYKAETRHN